ncbi:MAG: hypothetical protein GY864_06675 [Desulfobacterales bacterium]|nr:hypothetical protein [Desulfobacterales bacterium]
MTEPSGFIEVDMFPKEVDSLSHPEVMHLIQLLEDVAGEYECNLIHFDIKEGTAIFSFDSDILMAEIIGILQNDSQG